MNIAKMLPDRLNGHPGPRWNPLGFDLPKTFTERFLVALRSWWDYFLSAIIMTSLLSIDFHELWIAPFTIVCLLPASAALTAWTRSPMCQRKPQRMPVEFNAKNGGVRLGRTPHRDLVVVRLESLEMLVEVSDHFGREFMNDGRPIFVFDPSPVPLPNPDAPKHADAGKADVGGILAFFFLLFMLAMATRAMGLW